MNGQEWMGLATALGLGLGFFLKMVPNSKVETKAIPFVITGLMFIKNLLISSGHLPPDATLLAQIGFEVPAGVAFAMFGGSWFANLLTILLHSAVDAAVPVGIHSGSKNLMQLKAAKKVAR